jgi:hypothetical protein
MGRRFNKNTAQTISRLNKAPETTRESVIYLLYSLATGIT